MTRLHLVRHGRTVLNEQRRTQGAADSPLTAEGRRGAEVTRDHLARVPFTRAYLSPQGRVLETARILLEPHPKVSPVILDGLREYNYGIYEGGPDAEMHAAIPVAEHLPAVLRGDHPGASGGISASRYLDDIDGALVSILADLQADAEAGRDDEDVLVVSHGMTLMTIGARWIGPEVYRLGPMANCAVSTIAVDPRDPARSPELLSWAVDHAGQGVTFPVPDLGNAFADLVPVPIRWSRSGDGGSAVDGPVAAQASNEFSAAGKDPSRTARS